MTFVQSAGFTLLSFALVISVVVFFHELGHLIVGKALGVRAIRFSRSEEHTSELQSLAYLVCRLLLEKKKQIHRTPSSPALQRDLCHDIAKLADHGESRA